MPAPMRIIDVVLRRRPLSNRVRRHFGIVGPVDVIVVLVFCYGQGVVVRIGDEVGELLRVTAQPFGSALEPLRDVVPQAADAVAVLNVGRRRRGFDAEARGPDAQVGGV